jgi:hypothetical protein
VSVTTQESAETKAMQRSPKSLSIYLDGPSRRLTGSARRARMSPPPGGAWRLSGRQSLSTGAARARPDRTRAPNVAAAVECGHER